VAPGAQSGFASVKRPPSLGRVCAGESGWRIVNPPPAGRQEWRRADLDRLRRTRTGSILPRSVERYARANRQKPSGIPTKESIGRVHLIPRFGSLRLDTITSEHVQRLKLQLQDRSAKSVTNVLTTLNLVLKTAGSWLVLVRMP
jgi:hypothetical protein